MAHYDCTKNRFNPENRFIGDIENGLRYPFACYTKEESDERYAPIGLVARVAELEAQMADVLARLEAIEYNDIKITSFTASPIQIEAGASAQITLTWVVNKTSYTATINGQPVQGNSTTVTVSGPTQFTLSVTDGHSTDSKQCGVTTSTRIYYGADVDLSHVTQLQSIVSENKNRTFTVTAGAGKYIIYAYPKRLGLSEFWVEQFEGGFDEPVEQTITSGSGHSEVYYVYKSEQPNLGETTVEVKEAT